MELKWLMLNKHKRCFHSSRVKFPFVSMFASWFLVSIYLIGILGSKLILSNNQSSATLWVLETCLIVGLLLFMIIFITSSLSSKMYNKSSWREEFAFEETKSTLFRSSIIPGIDFRVRDVDMFPRTSLLWFVFPWRTVTIWCHKSSAGMPSILECEVDFDLQDLLQSRSLETVPVCIVLQYYPHNHIVCIHLCDECWRSNEIVVCHMLWSISNWSVQIYSLTIGYRVFQYVPWISIS